MRRLFSQPLVTLTSSRQAETCFDPPKHIGRPLFF
jgi:hypothetical protein